MPVQVDRTRHVCVFVLHIAKLIVVVFSYENVQPLSSFILKFCQSFDYLVTVLRAVQFCLYSYS